MAFADNFKHIASFNSANSAKFLETFNAALLDVAKQNCATPHMQTFAPSSSYCDRKIWFRLRGVQPDTPTNPDPYGEFIKAMGNACHIWVQSILKSHLGDDWVEVEDYLRDANVPYEYLCTKDGYETHVEIKDPPYRYTVDGLVRFNNKLYVMEIKSLEHSAFETIFEPRPKDTAQISEYQSLLFIENVLYVYIDRITGQIKCYEYFNPSLSYTKLMNKCREMMNMVENRIAPPRIEDKNFCSMCDYKKKCKEW